MLKTKTTLILCIIFLGLFFVFTNRAHAEVIHDFNSTINVLADSSILVNEKINYDFEGALRHGIYRTIPLINSKGQPIEVKVISVTDEKGSAYKYNETKSNGNISIQIGDADTMISGLKDYYISYRVLGSISYYDNFDEIYWNATGNEWQVPIEKAEAQVVLPNNIFPIQQSCYYGKLGSNTKCNVVDSSIFTAEKLNANEGLTVAVGFQKGVVSIYQAKVESKLTKFIVTFWPLLLPIGVFIYMFIEWWKKGRDPKGTGVIIAQYDVPDSLAPLEVGGIVNAEIKNQNISAEIIYLATMGFIKIKQIEGKDGKFLGLVSGKDYEFTLLKEGGLLVYDFDKKIIKAIFGDDGNVGGSVRLSALDDNFYKSIPEIKNSVIDILLSKKYFTNLPKVKMFPLIFALVWIAGGILMAGGFGDVGVDYSGNKIVTAVMCFSLGISILILIIFGRILPAKSKEGVLMEEYLLGLKEYLQIAEKDRLNFHNAPEKKPEIFEKLLTYAMVFGVVEILAKEFEDIYTTAPKWYDSKSAGFNAVGFGREMSSFGALANASFTSTPAGSGGAGFSGGGGGGGGGGSW